jgi:hypothetical protein
VGIDGKNVYPLTLEQKNMRPDSFDEYSSGTAEDKPLKQRLSDLTKWEGIDAHQHFWNYETVKHSWITDDMAVIRRDYLPGGCNLCCNKTVKAI